MKRRTQSPKSNQDNKFPNTRNIILYGWILFQAIHLLENDTHLEATPEKWALWKSDLGTKGLKIKYNMKISH